MKSALLLRILPFFLIPPTAARADESIRLRLRTFPPDAAVSLVTSDGIDHPLEPVGRDGNWRLFRGVAEGARIRLSSPGYSDAFLHLPDSSPRDADDRPGVIERVVEVEERLVSSAGPLSLISELPTGNSPKSAAFLPDGRIVVPLLRAPGVDVYRPRVDAWGDTHFEPAQRIGPAAVDALRDGFVEPLILADRGELWISQMTTNLLHRFDLASLELVQSIPAGGRWPKVMVADVGASTLYVSNWIDETVSVIDLESGAVTDTIAVGGTPRGIALSAGGAYLWVCLFSSGEILVVDTQTRTVVDRLFAGEGAARHIVASLDGEYLYYSDMHTGTVHRVDAARRRIIASRYVGVNLNTIVLDPAERYLYVSERGPNNGESYLLRGPQFGRIVVLDAQHLEPIQALWGRHQPTGLAVSDDGRFLAATDFLDNNVAIYRVDPSATPEVEGRGFSAP
ncbi:MAG: beta-propeller fold lactonase family protein [Spirochaetales bacterium]|nr:beta-propeller fold lactonase family protein [Spirochaetales bacterium]